MQVWKTTRKERPNFATRWLQRLLPKHPHLVHRALEMNRVDKWDAIAAQEGDTYMRVCFHRWLMCFSSTLPAFCSHECHSPFRLHEFVLSDTVHAWSYKLMYFFVWKNLKGFVSPLEGLNACGYSGFHWAIVTLGLDCSSVCKEFFLRKFPTNISQFFRLTQTTVLCES